MHKRDFSYALDAIKDGFKVARRGWNGKGMYVFLIGTDNARPECGDATCSHGVPPPVVRRGDYTGGYMLIKDSFGTRINIQQARNGKIIIPIARKHITLSKEDAEQFTLYDIEDFDEDLYRKAYQ